MVGGSAGYQDRGNRLDLQPQSRLVVGEAGQRDFGKARQDEGAVMRQLVRVLRADQLGRSFSRFMSRSVSGSGAMGSLSCELDD